MILTSSADLGERCEAYDGGGEAQPNSAHFIFSVKARRTSTFGRQP